MSPETSAMFDPKRDVFQTFGINSSRSCEGPWPFLVQGSPLRIFLGQEERPSWPPVMSDEVLCRKDVMYLSLINFRMGQEGNMGFVTFLLCLLGC